MTREMAAVENQLRHARTCSGHPRHGCFTSRKTWMARTSPAMTDRLPLDLGKIRNRRSSFTDLVQELEAVLAPVGHLDVHRHFVEERIDVGTQLGDHRHSA